MGPSQSDRPALYYAELAQEDLAALPDFTCGNDEWDGYLNDFLKEDALEQAAARFNKTYTFYDDSGQLVAYAALSASEVRNQTARASPLLTDAPYQRIPALLIGRLAVDERHQGSGFGSAILGWIEKTATLLPIGCRFLALHVDERNDAAIRFYVGYGFFRPPHIEVRDHLQLMLYDLKPSEEANTPA